MPADPNDLLHHYSRGGLLEAILGALKAEGKDTGALTVRDLAPVDQFHTRGLEATRELADFGAIPPGSQVLDVGSGLGGPARYLAAEHGLHVTGVDLVPEFCQVAETLAGLSGLAERARFQQGSALDLPFPDASFDACWTVQVQMNVENKARFYGEITRVLRPGGRFVFQDIMQGNGEPLEFPVPWATVPGQSFLAPPERVRALLGALGLQEVAWRDVSAATIAWRKAQAPKAPGAPPPLGMHLVMGPGTAEKLRNAARNLDAGRIAFIQGVFIKPA